VAPVARKGKKCRDARRDVMRRREGARHRSGESTVGMDGRSRSITTVDRDTALLGMFAFGGAGLPGRGGDIRTHRGRANRWGLQVRRRGDLNGPPRALSMRRLRGRSFAVGGGGGCRLLVSGCVLLCLFLFWLCFLLCLFFFGFSGRHGSGTSTIHQLPTTVWRPRADISFRHAKSRYRVERSTSTTRLEQATGIASALAPGSRVEDRFVSAMHAPHGHHRGRRRSSQVVGGDGARRRPGQWYAHLALVATIPARRRYFRDYTGYSSSTLSPAAPTILRGMWSRFQAGSQVLRLSSAWAGQTTGTIPRTNAATPRKWAAKSSASSSCYHSKASRNSASR